MDAYPINYDFFPQQTAIEENKDYGRPNNSKKTEDLIRQINSMATFGITSVEESMRTHDPHWDNQQLINVAKAIMNARIHDNGSEQHIEVASPFGRLNIAQTFMYGEASLTVKVGDIQITMTRKSLHTLQAQLRRELITAGVINSLFTPTQLQTARCIINAPIEEVEGCAQIEINDTKIGKIAIIQMREEGKNYLVAKLNGVKFKLDRNIYTTLDALKNQAGSAVIKSGDIEPLFSMGDVGLAYSSIVNSPIQTNDTSQQIEISTLFGKMTIIDREGAPHLIGKLNGVEFEFGRDALSHLTLKKLQIHLGNVLVKNGIITSPFTTGGFNTVAPNITNAVCQKDGQFPYIESDSSFGKIRIEETSDNRFFALPFSQPTPLKITLDDIEVVNTKFITIESLQTHLKRADEFKNKLTGILTTYSQVVASIVKKSVTLDVVNNAPTEIINAHSDAIKYIRQDTHSDSDQLWGTLKSSTGNCYEMALVCKGMLDLYLLESLKQLGYKNVSIQSTIITAPSPADHAVVKFKCAFEGNTLTFIVDPWSEGKAWAYEDGMTCFRERTPDRYTHPDIFFIEKDNSQLETPEYKNKAQAFFNHFKIKKELDTAIAIKNKGINGGLPEKAKEIFATKTKQQPNLTVEKNKSKEILTDASGEFVPLNPTNSNDVPSAGLSNYTSVTTLHAMKISDWKAPLNFKIGFGPKQPKPEPASSSSVAEKITPFADTSSSSSEKKKWDVDFKSSAFKKSSQ